ncbi:LPXTG cell wall anchor domain-containing protein [Limosilactobacillus reuteri]|uniref:LPXTG cell wall anchor domain-containing protein n=1 Tax=Limosilactobacillus reuteri TaxID=1598 RepID=UPI001E62FA43|nr:LPXTG cell wall anchor domain-containing protein [Limosilactobacillus reuteri]MCC4325405.1 LPXTG cell wall anchor domain-containing protein [Limosilactobacillus reuteri]MCC4329124.1 LPXTG cell wall anchor domain-containing protein [Limosilactobacillus reuteri]MCC4352570.1 LPXTG cell wall anchor domain-containing protein [Limosilactobacillus reuteri]MCC4377826.1 LPXTG cell wall anchor domain-containing protein [Limosilactobacillus reuteri]
MENQVHYKLFKNGKFLCTMALSTVAVLTTLGATGTVHADATPVQNSNEQSEQTSQSAYQQKASQNEQQLSDLASANATKEANAANSYAQANLQSANATSQQIADIQNQYTQKKPQAKQQIQAASDAMASSVASQTQVVNNSAASATSATQQANATSEAQMQSANAAAIAQAQQQAQDAAAHSAAAISAANSNYQVAVDSANATHQLATSAANADYTANVNNENNTYRANQQQVKNDVTAAQNAVNQAQQDVKDHTTTQTVTVPGQKRTIDHITNAAEKRGNSTNWTSVGSGTFVTSPIEESYFRKSIYYNTIMGMYPGQTPYSREDAANHTAVYDYTHVPTNVSEMPTDFQPGLLIYNPDLDTSEVVSSDGFTEAQKQTIRAFMASWANSFRNWIYNNDRDVWNEANKFHYFKDQAPHELKFTTTMNAAGDKIGQMRTDAGLTNDQHTIPSGTTNVDYAKAIPSINITGQQVGNYMVNAVQSNMENLMTVEPSTIDSAKPTMLNYLISAYNMTQAMWYGEIYSNGLGGHARGILSNDLGYITGGFEKMTPSTFSNELTNNEKSYRENYAFSHNMPLYAFTYDAYDYVPYVMSLDDQLNVLSSLPNDQKVVDAYNRMQSTIDNAMGQEIQDPTFMSAVSYEKNGDGSRTETKQVTPQQYTDALNNAKSHLTQVTNDANSKLQQLAQTHQDHLKNLESIRDNAIKQADTALQNAVRQAKQTCDNKIAEAKGSQVNVDALKKSLDDKYQQLVASDKAKLDKIETDRQTAIKQIQATAQSEYDAKLKELGVDDQAVQAQIKQLQDAHDTFVKENADKLAQLKAEDAKAYNDLKAKLDAELATLMPKHETNTDNSGNVINTGDHTIVLPDDTKNESATHNNASQSSNATDTDSVENKNQSAKDVAQEHPSANSDNSKSTASLAEKNNNSDNQTQTSVATANVDTNNDDTAVTVLAVNATSESVTMTRKEDKQQTKKLPQTGNSQSLVLVALGTLTSMFGFGLMRKRRY